MSEQGVQRNWKALTHYWAANDTITQAMRRGIITTLTLSRISASSPKTGETSVVVNGVSVLLYAHPQLFKVFKHLIYV